MNYSYGAISQVESTDDGRWYSESGFRKDAGSPTPCNGLHSLQFPCKVPEDKYSGLGVIE